MHRAAHQGTEVLRVEAGAENYKDVAVLFGKRKVVFKERLSQYYSLRISILISGVLSRMKYLRETSFIKSQPCGSRPIAH
jgi:hypothetical protein